MSILVFALIVLVVAALFAWAAQKLPLPSPFGMGVDPDHRRRGDRSARRAVLGRGQPAHETCLCRLYEVQ